jgi:hypothetical protein
MNTNEIVQKLWNLCNILKDDGITYHPREKGTDLFPPALDAKGLFSTIKVAELLEAGINSKKSALERHHLFPKNYLRKLGVTDKREVNQVANFAMVEWHDNIAIPDEPPSSYWDRYSARFSSEDLRKMMCWHALPDGWHQMPYKEFLEQRRVRIARVIESGFNALGRPASIAEGKAAPAEAV